MLLGATMDLTREGVTSAVNEQYDHLLQEEQIQRTATEVAEFIQPAHAMVTAQDTNQAQQPTLTEEQRGWLIIEVINLLSLNQLSNPTRCHAYSMSAIIRAIAASQTHDPNEIATALIAHADARYEARQDPVPADATPASSIANAATAQATVPKDESVIPLTVQEDAENKARCFKALRVALIKNNVSLHLDRDQAAQVERAQDRLHQTTPVNFTAHWQREETTLTAQANVTTAGISAIAPAIQEQLDQETEDTEARRNEAIKAHDRLPIVTAEGTSGDLLAAYRSTQLQQEEMTATRARLDEANHQDITPLRRGPSGPAPFRFSIP
jgi:hypothetical protein